MWGSSDFISRQSSRKIGSYLSTLYVNAFGFVMVLIYAVASGSLDLAKVAANPEVLALNAIVGVFTFGGLLSLYRGYLSGIMSVVSPVAGAYPAVTILLGFVILGTTVSLPVGLGIAVIFVGMGLAGVKLSDLRSPEAHGKRFSAGLDYGLLTFLLFGVAFFGLAISAQAFGFIIPILVLRGTAAVTSFALLKPMKQKLVFPVGRTLALVTAMSLLDTSAYLIYNYSSLLGAHVLPVVVTISGQFSVVTILLARTFYREKLEPVQYLGVAAILVGIAVISYF
jgi:drug/metabolite transporter (DMT)-like permease